MKILRSKENLSRIVTHVPLQELTQLYPVVSFDQYNAILQDIQDNGMQFPIVIWETVGKYWRKWVRFTDPELINYPPETLGDFQPVLLVMCGNNRFQAAKHLNYDAIDCVLCTEREEINKLCGIMREHWRAQQAN